MGLFFVLMDLAYSAIQLVIAWRFFVGALPSVWAAFWQWSHEKGR
jgi:hypothetical protein